MLNIAVLVSGGGTNLQALLDAEDSGLLHSGRIVLVVADRPGCFARERAKNHGVENYMFSRKKPDFEERLAKILSERNIDVIVLAGFLYILSPALVRKYEGRILNIHPALIPSFCGPGMYGLHVHEAALRRGVKITGATVHLVNEIADGGEILAQKAVPVLPGDTPEILQRRVMEQAEWLLLAPETEALCQRLSQQRQ